MAHFKVTLLFVYTPYFDSKKTVLSSRLKVEVQRTLYVLFHTRAAATEKSVVNPWTCLWYDKTETCHRYRDNMPYKLTVIHLVLAFFNEYKLDLRPYYHFKSSFSELKYVNVTCRYYSIDRPVSILQVVILVTVLCFAKYFMRLDSVHSDFGVL